MSAALLTGATGYIGGRLAARLVADGWRVEAIVRPSSDLADLPGDVQPHVHDGSAAGLAAIVAAARPDVVFHLASLYLSDHRPDEVETLVTSNVLFPAQLAEAMTGAGITRLVNTGTASQHLDGAAYDPVSLYAATKQACGDILHWYHVACGLSVITLKLFDTYGLADKRRKLVAVVAEAAAAGTPLGLSPGEQTVDLTHVDDVVEAFVVAAERLLAMERPVMECFFVSGERFTVRELALHVGDVLERPVDATFGARGYRPREVMMPIDPTGVLLPGWSPRRRLAATLPALASGTSASRGDA